MVGFDAEGLQREFGSGEDEVLVLLAVVGFPAQGTGPQKPRRQVLEVLDIV